MLIKVLRGAEPDVADGALCTGTLLHVRVPGWATTERVRVAHEQLPAVGRRLLDVVDRGEMSLEHIGAVERLLERGAGTRAEGTHHNSFVVGECVPVLVILASEPLGVVLARLDGTFLWTLFLVREHV
jgi:hypothetical protein